MDASDLVTYLRDPEVSATDPALLQIVELTNDVVDAALGVIDPEPPGARAIRYRVAARAWRNIVGVASRTQSSSIDDYQESTTVRMDGADAGTGVYLTAAEEVALAALGQGIPVVTEFSGSLPYWRSW